MIFLAFFTIAVLAALAATVFWVLELIDCLQNEPDHGNSKLIWLLVIFFGHFFGALLYRFVRRPQRKQLLGR